MKMLSHHFIQCTLVAGLGVLIVSNAIAQSLETDKQIGLRLQTLTTGEKILHWNGQANYTYFIQATPDLSDWTWAPNIEPGIAGPMSYEVDGPTAKGFFRLIRSPQTAADLDSADFDGDGFTNLREITPRLRPGGTGGYAGLNPNIQTNPIDFDTDHDGLNDKWEEDHGLDPTDNGSRDVNNGALGDPDGDGLNNLQEFIYLTDPMDFGNRSPHSSQDSDGNGLPDWWEILHFGVLGNNPNQTMPGSGGLTMLEIFNNNLVIGVSSSMSDGISDSWKIANGLDTEDPDIANKDADTDGLTNLDEYEANTNPNNQDTDGEGIIDGRDLYPLIPDPSTPSSFYVGVPSWDEQNESPEPDWQEVDCTSVELRWESSSNNPGNYIIERRCDNDIWQQLATVSGGSTTYGDSGLVANKNYEYRIRAIKAADGAHVSSQVVITTYQVPLDLQMHVKTAGISRSKSGFTEFTSPSSPPKHYLKKTEISSETVTNRADAPTYSRSGSFSYTRIFTPALQKWSYVGSGSNSEQSSGHDSSGDWSSSSSGLRNFSGMTQPRSRQSLIAINQSESSNSNQSSSVSPSSSSSSSSGGTGSYLLKRTYVPTEGPARWAGTDYDLSKGTLNFSGHSIVSSYNNPSGGQNTTTAAHATVSGTNTQQWSGTATDASGTTSNISSAPYQSWWDASGYRRNAISTTQTEIKYSYSPSGGNVAYSSEGTDTLSEEYSTDAFIADTINELADYQDKWIQDYWGWGTWGINEGWYYGNGTNGSSWEAAEWSLSATEDSFSTSKFKYKFTANPSAPTTMRWAEIFIPEDDEDTLEIDESKKIEIIAERTWELTGSENESPEFEIDPTTTPPSRNGHYNILLRPVAVSISGIGEAGKNVGGQDSSPGKVVLINDGDADNDGIADYADGYNRHSSVDADNESPGVSFIPIHIGFQAVDPAEGKIKFTFDASNPQGITSNSTTPQQLPANGRIRLWTKDGSQQRDSDSISLGGDIIKSGVAYSLEDLGLEESSCGDFTVFAEVVKTSDSVADIPVKVEIRPNANLGYVFSDQIRFTGVKIETCGRGYGETEFTIGIPFVASNLKDFDTKVAMFGTTPGAFATYKVRVFDPRSNVGNLRIQGQQVSLARESRVWETPEFVLLGSGGQNDYSNSPQLRLRIAGPSVSMSYNPAIIEKFLNTIKIDPLIQQAYAAVDQAQKAMKAGGWTPPPSTTNPGLFGNEVHQWVSEYFAPTNGTPRRGWVADVFVDNGTGVVLSIGELPPGGVAGTTQIDLMSVKGNYRPVVTRPLDPKQILHVFDIKTSARISAKNIGSFVDRIYALTGKNKLYLPQVQERYSIPKEGWFPNKSVVRFKKLAKWCAALGVVASLAVLPESEAKADECIKYAIDYREALKSGNFADINVAQIAFYLRMQQYMAMYSQSPIQDGMHSIALANWLLTEDAKVFDEDPEYDTP